jgi:hypothetical protein
MLPMAEPPAVPVVAALAGPRSTSKMRSLPSAPLRRMRCLLTRRIRTASIPTSMLRIRSLVPPEADVHDHRHCVGRDPEGVIERWPQGAQVQRLRLRHRDVESLRGLPPLAARSKRRLRHGGRTRHRGCPRGTRVSSPSSWTPGSGRRRSRPAAATPGIRVGCARLPTRACRCAYDGPGRRRVALRFERTEGACGDHRSLAVRVPSPPALASPW